MPELPEVESLASDLRDRAVRRVIDRTDIAEFSVLKTYDPPLTALHGGTLEDVTRHGKFLDLIVSVPGAASGKLHLITHLARGGWLRWREEMPAAPTRPGKGPLAFRLRFTDGAGFDLTEASQKLVKEGNLEFLIDQQPYQQGFLPTLQLFFWHVSGSTSGPATTDTGLKFVTKEGVGPYIETKSRYQGTSTEAKVVPIPAGTPA